MPFDRGHCQIPYPSPGPKGWGFQLTGALLRLSKRLIISTESKRIYINSFPNAPTSKRAQNHEISIYFSTNSIVALCHAPT